MTPTTLRTLLYLTAAALFAAPTIAAADDKPAEPMKPSKLVQAVQDNDVEDFFETAASADLFEIEAGKLGEQRGTTPDVKQYARRMVTDHRKTSEELKQLARSKGITLPTRMLKRHEAMLDDLKNESDGAGFDDEFRDKMITSHKEAVSLFDQAARKSKDADVKAFAQKHLAHLQDHGAKARDLPNP